MAALTVDDSHGAALTLPTSSYAPEFISGTWSDFTIQVIETTHLSSTEPTSGTNAGGRTYKQAKVGDPGRFRGRFHWDSDEPPPAHGAAELLRLTWPLGSGSTAGYWEATGFVEDFSIETPESGNKMIIEITWKLSGLITFQDEV